MLPLNNAKTFYLILRKLIVETILTSVKLFMRKRFRLVIIYVSRMGFWRVRELLKKITKWIFKNAEIVSKVLDLYLTDTAPK